MARGWESLLVADGGQGPAVLLVHGQPGSAEDWGDVVDVLGPGLRLLVVDRPGYGSSDVPPASMAENADQLADLLVSRRAAPAVVVGHSYGGGIALLMATQRPEAVSGLVLLGSIGGAGSVNGLDHVLAVPGVGEALCAAGLFTFGRVLPHLHGLVARLPDGTAQRWRASLPDDRYAAELSKSGVRLWRSFVAEQRSLLREIGDVERAATRVDVPTTVVSGTWDMVVPPSSSADLAAAIAGAELVTIAGVGHFPGRDAPGVVAAAVRQTVERARHS